MSLCNDRVVFVLIVNLNFKIIITKYYYISKMVFVGTELTCYLRVYFYYPEGGVLVSNYVSKEIRVHRTPSSSILLVKMLAKTDVVSKTVS